MSNSSQLIYAYYSEQRNKYWLVDRMTSSNEEKPDHRNNVASSGTQPKSVPATGISGSETKSGLWSSRFDTLLLLADSKQQDGLTCGTCNLGFRSQMLLSEHYEESRHKPALVDPTQAGK